MTPMEIQLLISGITIFGSGISVYVGVRIALTEHKVELKEHSRRLTVLEAKVFK